MTYFALDLESDPLSSLPESTPSDLRAILTRYRQVLFTPKGLPPPRSHDHAIVLHDGTSPVKVRPYRYPYAQKTLIELMVNDMLRDGLIQPSTSPFSAHVLLVKKKRVHGGSVLTIEP